MSQSMIDHRGPKFPALVFQILDGLKAIFKTVKGQVLLFPGSGTGAWEAAIVNTLSPGDRVLACINGHFAALFSQTAAAHRMQIDRLAFPYGDGIAADQVEARLRNDKERRIKAVLAVHNETSTAVTSDVAAVRQALDRADHPALLLVDAVSALGCIDFRMDEWRVDVAIAAPQKGLMLPPGMAILAASDKALQANRTATSPRSFWDWAPVLEKNTRGEFPYTPATPLLFGLKESLAMLAEEGLPQVFRRHARLAEACRRAVQGMGLKLLPKNPSEYSNTVTAACMPVGFDADAYIEHAHSKLELSLGMGLGEAKGRVFRIGHLGSLNELELLGALSGVEMTLRSFGIEMPLGAGLAAAETYLLETAPRGEGRTR